MSFAYWRKCDFQIHTPRDNGWIGPRPIGLGDNLNGSLAIEAQIFAQRMDWATGFVEACAQRGLEAVALTDHHEMVMVPYVKEAIRARKAQDPEFDLWLFPGMELTCHGGVQCLLIFDADLSDDWLIAAQGKLGTTTPGHSNLAARSPNPVQQLTTPYPDIAPELDAIGAEIRGKYILLPNVSQGGSHTVLSAGKHADFRRMPYVGGYLDHGQTIDTLSSNRQRLSGTDPMWGDRFIYPLPTSDSRNANYATLGDNHCWIKLAAPTAEAIRQAFLGYKSRISLVPPETASLAVAEVELRGSTILRDVTLALSPELNSFIGGRGSGKSSMLEYIAFGLGRSCYDLAKVDYSGSERMSSLIAETLVSSGGSIKLDLVQDGARFSISRGPGARYQPQVTYPNGEVQPLGARELRALFPAVVYSQGELSELGKKAGRSTQLSELLQFVSPDYKKEDDQLTSEIENARDGIRSAVQKLAAAWRSQSDLHKLETAKASLDQRIEALQKTLPTLAAADKATVDRFEKLSAFDALRAQGSYRAQAIMDQLGELWNSGKGRIEMNSDAPEAAEFIRKFSEFDDVFRKGLTEFGKAVSEKRKELEASAETFAKIYGDARSARDTAMAKLSAHRTVTAQISALQKDAEAAALNIAELRTKMRAPDEMAQVMNAAVDRLKKAVKTRGDRTADWAREIETLSNGRIKAKLNNEGDISEVREAIDLVAAKTGSQSESRQKQVDECVAASGAWGFLDNIRSECLNALHYKQIGSSQNGEKPSCAMLFQTLGGTDRTHAACFELIDLSRVEAVATATPRPDITLLYCDHDRTISFEKASEGQRAAALLFMLLQQRGGPLLVDQPEGDLDNSVIAELSDVLHEAKQKRQIIFASHNANVVVNGSSELVSHLEVGTDGMRTHACVGAIDLPEVCQTITATMEGGKQAFRDRQIKYGY